jgi:hypothetical protein
MSSILMGMQRTKDTLWAISDIPMSSLNHITRVQTVL